MLNKVWLDSPTLGMVTAFRLQLSVSSNRRSIGRNIVRNIVRDMTARTAMDMRHVKIDLEAFDARQIDHLLRQIVLHLRLHLMHPSVP